MAKADVQVHRNEANRVKSFNLICKIIEQNPDNPKNPLYLFMSSHKNNKVLNYTA